MGVGTSEKDVLMIDQSNPYIVLGDDTTDV